MVSVDCVSAYTRWLHRACYCPTGSFYLTEASLETWPWSRSKAASSFHNVWNGADGNDVCVERGIQAWSLWFWGYVAVSVSAFTFVLFLSSRRLWCVLFTRSMSLQTATHVFCGLAAGQRVFYIIVQAVSVSAPMRPLPLVEVFIQISRGTFYTLAAGAFLCIVEYWQRMICYIDDVPSRELHRKPLFFAVIGAFIAEVIHDIVSLRLRNPVLDTIHSLGLGLFSTAFAITGVAIARRLYSRVSQWITGSHTQALGKILFCAVALSIITLCFVIILVAQAMYSRFFVWPCLLAWFSTRVLEVAYLSVVLHTSASQQIHAPSTSITFSGDISSSTMSSDLPALSMQALFIGSARGSLRVLPEWTESVCDGDDAPC
uniref:Uncharacterized protein n=1 Tax=Noctiluca scintillans TaxID=2966 RepID=A0A7S1AFM6_NOCSC|mmetsp:Transcript_44467/g.118076  ORF Transcript_44467/g.118076 Transcript_44467/m.118076 type:complete len:374 (+) Transcript_44467:71-1192(+)